MIYMGMGNSGSKILWNLFEFLFQADTRQEAIRVSYAAAFLIGDADTNNSVIHEVMERAPGQGRATPGHSPHRSTQGYRSGRPRRLPSSGRCWPPPPWTIRISWRPWGCTRHSKRRCCSVRAEGPGWGQRLLPGELTSVTDAPVHGPAEPDQFLDGARSSAGRTVFSAPVPDASCFASSAPRSNCATGRSSPTAPPPGHRVLTSSSCPIVTCCTQNVPYAEAALAQLVPGLRPDLDAGSCGLRAGWTAGDLGLGKRRHGPETKLPPRPVNWRAS